MENSKNKLKIMIIAVSLLITAGICTLIYFQNSKATNQVNLPHINMTVTDDTLYCCSDKKIYSYDLTNNVKQNILEENASELFSVNDSLYYTSDDGLYLYNCISKESELLVKSDKTLSIIAVDNKNLYYTEHTYSDDIITSSELFDYSLSERKSNSLFKSDALISKGALLDSGVAFIKEKSSSENNKLCIIDSKSSENQSSVLFEASSIYNLSTENGRIIIDASLTENAPSFLFEIDKNKKAVKLSDIETTRNVCIYENKIYFEGYDDNDNECLFGLDLSSNNIEHISEGVGNGIKIAANNDIIAMHEIPNKIVILNQKTKEKNTINI